MIHYECPKCQGPMASPESVAGWPETCPICGNVTIVPARLSSPQAMLGEPAPPAPPAGEATPMGKWLYSPQGVIRLTALGIKVLKIGKTLGTFISANNIVIVVLVVLTAGFTAAGVAAHEANKAMKEVTEESQKSAEAFQRSLKMLYPPKISPPGR